MSELTRCNFCTLNMIKRHAEKEGLKVTILHEQGGINVYVHNPKLVMTDIPGGASGDRKKYFRAWLMSISPSCCC